LIEKILVVKANMDKIQFGPLTEPDPDDIEEISDLVDEEILDLVDAIEEISDFENDD